MRLPRLSRSKKSRKYPVQRDQEGKSLRSRCIERFNQNRRPAEVAKELNMPPATAQRYFRDWKILGPNFERLYAFVKGLFKKTNPEREKNIDLFALTLGIKKEQFEVVLLQPHGLRRFLTGKLYFPVQAEADHKLHIALALGLLVADHLGKNGGKYEDIYHSLQRFMVENQRCREDEEAEIKHWNQLMHLIHKLLALELEKERQSSVKPEILSKEERETVMRREGRKMFKELQGDYWACIARLMAEGHTEKQAREKMYQDILNRGDEEKARKMREFQEVVHPLQNDNQQTLPTANPPSSS